MQAVVYEKYGDGSVLEVKDFPKPVAGAGEVLIKIRATGVNPVDWKLREGYLATMWPNAFPQIPGWDAAGVVEAVGDGVTKFAVGDQVSSYTRPEFDQPGKEHEICTHKFGTCAEFIAVAEHKVAKMAEGLTFEQAAAIPLAALTAWQGVFDHGALKSGETVLVLAASGGVGSFAVQFAKNAGATVIGTCSGKNADYVKSLGCDHVIDYSKGDVAAAVKALCPGGIDLCYDAVGGDSAKDAVPTVKKAADGGRFVTIAWFTIFDEMKDGPKPGLFVVTPNGKELEAIGQSIADKKVALPTITTFAGLAKTAEVHALSASGRTQGKLVITV